MMNETTGQEIAISAQRQWSWREFFFQWEWLLVLVLLLVFGVNTYLSPYFLSIDTFVRTPATFLDKGFIVFPMMLVIILGKIDISVGSTVALSAVIMAVSYNAGLPMPAAMALCVAVGTLCGAINGIMIARFKELSFVIVTISTMMIYRGIAYIVLENRAAGGFPQWFSFLGWGEVAGIPVMFLAFALVALVYGLLLHRTSFGRVVYGMGNNATACRYSGVDTDRITMIVFTLAGLMSGITALFLTSRMGSTRPNVAMGYELEVIAMVVLGGVSTSGGIGRIGGPILAIFIVGFLGFGMGLANLQAPVVLVVIGLLLIVSVLALKVRFNAGKKKAGSAALLQKPEKTVGGLS